MNILLLKMAAQLVYNANETNTAFLNKRFYKEPWVISEQDNKLIAAGKFLAIAVISNKDSALNFRGALERLYAALRSYHNVYKSNSFYEQDFGFDDKRLETFILALNGWDGITNG